jgi:pyridoxal phosphate enzyme (YggS family)
MNSIAERVAAIQQRIVDACGRAGRPSQSVRLMAVSKTYPSEAMLQAYAAGVRLFGENRVQEFAAKTPDLRDLDAEFRLIGHLQTNKSSKAAELFHAIDSVDSLKLARKLNSDAEKLGKIIPILVEINTGGEEAKSGFPPNSLELDELLTNAAELQNLRIRGLMTIPPHTEDPEGARPYFRLLREFRGRINARQLANVSMEELSMGMSHDFEVAIVEGSTCVRIGTAIFGTRIKR